MDGEKKKNTKTVKTKPSFKFLRRSVDRASIKLKKNAPTCF